MNSINEASVNDGRAIPLLEDEIDIKNILYSLNRNRRLIAKFIFSGLFISGLIIFSTKRVWEGEFQIVLENNEVNRPSLLKESGLSNVLNISGGNDSLITEVGILKSPLVLMNIFEFVKKEKEFKNNQIRNLNFKKWKESYLKIDLEKNSTILNITYKDNDKDLVIPVLNKISTTYQDYSGRKRLRGLELGSNFYEEQIGIFKSRSIDSLRKSQKFANDQDLSVLPNDFKSIESASELITSSSIDLEIPNAINIEAIRVAAANKIRFIDQQLEQINKLNDQSSEQIMYIASTIPALQELSAKLKLFESDLARLRLIYKESDKNIKNLVEQRNFSIELLKRQVKGFLIAQKADAQARLKSAERPAGTLIEYKMLLSNAFKDKATLDNLENEYRKLLLEKARSTDPWELITTPTLSPNPIAPKKIKILALGLIAGIFTGSVAALISDKRKDIIFSLVEIESYGFGPVLTELSFVQKQSWTESIDLVISGPLSEIKGSIAFLAVGEIDEEELMHLSKLLRKFTNSPEIIITKDLREAVQCPNLIVITALGITRNQELIEARQKLLLQRTSILGLIALT
ncbi:Hypothetical protein NATL1_08771 [Prochlorococcus marinus str. NATL1A]|uniref:Polysaccharide chain length determinant N-terminal domain-containing protein n=1 Tax=Prochlorococcus marinus (strain NATL1A) TaxID=167555 RepID=A2C1S5_PROM1|nr:Wzz/FepE/Etk N-terminal domain-containing protein [Prochlorococcus marinus]ABM75435.1 Hypothetical protein NATL1_08771 [Prochlorococcus marinus str. NATL1A]